VDNFVSPSDERAARTNVAPFGPRVRMLKATSLDAAASFALGHFDWLYIDALHTYEAVLSDLRAWWPRLRDGGLLSGDDYGDMADTPLVSAERFGRYYGWVAKASRWGTIRAVQQFAGEVDRQLFVTWMKAGLHSSSISEYRAGDLAGRSTGCYTYPAWYIIK